MNTFVKNMSIFAFCIQNIFIEWIINWNITI
jgi:hypothetical protein